MSLKRRLANLEGHSSQREPTMRDPRLMTNEELFSIIDQYRDTGQLGKSPRWLQLMPDDKLDALIQERGGWLP